MRAHGLRGIYRGLPVTVIRETPSYGAYFAAYDALCTWLTPAGTHKSDLSWPRLLLAGGIGGMIGWLSTYPFDVIKTKMQGETPATGGASAPLRRAGPLGRRGGGGGCNSCYQFFCHCSRPQPVLGL